MKKYIAMMLILSLMFMYSVTAFAVSDEPIVTFSSSSKDFTFNNVMISDDDKNTPDLFTNFKNIVPGDKLTQNIVLKVKDIKEDEQVKIYLKSELENDDYTTLLESINLTVKNEEKDITEKLDDNILLGAFTENETLDIALELDIPTTVGNEISDLTANIDWVFTAEVIEDTIDKKDSNNSNTDTNIPQTGDTSHIIVWSILIVILSLGIVLIKKK